MEGFVAGVQQTLKQVRDLFGSPVPVLTSATTEAAATGTMPGWSGNASTEQRLAATALNNQHTTLTSADTALDRFSRQLATDTATSRHGIDDVILSAHRTTVALAPYTHTLAGRVALATSLTDHLATATNIVTGYGTTLPTRQQQLTNITTQYNPTTPPNPHHHKPQHRAARRLTSPGGGYPARYQLAGAFRSFQPPQFSPPSLGGGGFSSAGFRTGGGMGPGGGISSLAVVPPGDGSQGSRAVNFAAEKLGLMYKWGGKGGPGDGGRVDCSGLTHWAYKRLGIEIGSSTYSQIGHGFQIPPGSIRPGDLIFCEFDEGGNPGPGHVVMATGYGPHSRIIQASHDGAPVAFGLMPQGHIVVKRIVP
jgi:cell wall-associated NlpC family hydrolase